MHLRRLIAIGLIAAGSVFTWSGTAEADVIDPAETSAVEAARPVYEIYDETIERVTGGNACISMWEDCGEPSDDAFLCYRAPDHGPWIIIDVNGTCDVEDDPLVCVFYPEDGEPGAVTFSEPCERDGATITL